MPNSNWINNPALNKMDPRKKKIMMELMRQSKGVPMNQSLPLIMNAQKQLSMQGLSFSPDEKSLLFAILTADMNPQEMQRFEAVKKMMGIK